MPPLALPPSDNRRNSECNIRFIFFFCRFSHFDRIGERRASRRCLLAASHLYRVRNYQPSTLIGMNRKPKSGPASICSTVMEMEIRLYAVESVRAKEMAHRPWHRFVQIQIHWNIHFFCEKRTEGKMIILFLCFWVIKTEKQKRREKLPSEKRKLKGEKHRNFLLVKHILGAVFLVRVTHALKCDCCRSVRRAHQQVHTHIYI